LPAIEYWNIIRRRWWIVVLIVALDLVVSGYLYRKADKSAGYQACLTLYVADVSAPSTISAPQTTLETAGQLLAGETAANFFADDILDVAQSTSVADFMKRRALASGRAEGSDLASGFAGTVSGSRKDRTVGLCVSKPVGSTALAGGEALATAMTTERFRFIGKQMAKRTFVQVISAPQVGPAPRSHALLNFLLRVALGLLVALGLAYLWDAVDPTVRNVRDAEAALGVPVLSAD
jgi:capsular polysaccharide biosynthesis protein